MSHTEPDIHIDETVVEPEPKERFNYRLVFILVIILAGCLYLASTYVQLTKSPTTFPTETAFSVLPGEHAAQIAEKLETEGFIRSAFVFGLILDIYHEDRFIQAGNYRFDIPLDAYALAETLTSGDSTLPPVVLTIPEGLRGATMAPFITSVLPNIDKAELTTALDAHLGYLFPDTYFIPDDYTAEKLIMLMQETFDEKTADIDFSVVPNGLTKEEVIILASIIEREANSVESMKLVSGVLHNRLEIDMALQVDATFEYLLGKESRELTEADLELDSPYNTYEYPGLPPTPIANPGLAAITAAIYPEETDFFYYLTGKDGGFYYAETFAEHKQNKVRYLR